MILARDTVLRALKKIGVMAEDEEATAYQFAEGLDALNDMLAGLRPFGVDIGHSELLADSPFPMPREFHDGIVHMLAMRLSATYALPVGFSADEFLRNMQAAYMKIEEVEMPGALLRTDIDRRRF
jgi:hypothetical protein